MAFEAIKAQIRSLLEGMIEEPADVHELHQTIREQLNELRASGMPLPQDLVDLEKQLQASTDTLPEE